MEKNTNKRPFFKNGFVWAVILFIAAFPASSISDSMIIICLFASIIVLLITIFKRIRSKKATNSNESIQESTQPAKQPYTTERFKIAGVSYRQKEIESIGEPNPDYDLSKSELLEQYSDGDKIYRLDFFPKIELVKEPTNKYDNNAIRIMANGVHIGYVPRDKTKRINELIDANKIIFIGADIEGGKYKMIDGNSIEKDEFIYYGQLEVRIKAD